MGIRIGEELFLFRRKHHKQRRNHQSMYGQQVLLLLRRNQRTWFDNRLYSYEEQLFRRHRYRLYRKRCHRLRVLLLHGLHRNIRKWCRSHENKYV